MACTDRVQMPAFSAASRSQNTSVLSPLASSSKQARRTTVTRPSSSGGQTSSTRWLWWLQQWTMKPLLGLDRSSDMNYLQAEALLFLGEVCSQPAGG